MAKVEEIIYFLKPFKQTMIQITPSAKSRICELVPGGLFRIEVIGGGCSGFKYHFSIPEKKEEDDIEIDLNQTKILIDPISLGFLDESVLDFEDDLAASCFTIKNNKAKSKCGCGNSFSV